MLSVQFLQIRIVIPTAHCQEYCASCVYHVLHAIYLLLLFCRTLSDIKDSIQELQYYRQKIFKD